MPSKNDKDTIHRWVGAMASTVGALPAGVDVIALKEEEIAMVIHVAGLFGMSLTHSAAEGIIAAEFGEVIGGTAIFESVNNGYPSTIPAKISIAGGVLDTLGKAAYYYFEKKS